MTLINSVYIPTGIVMSSDSRTSGEGIVLSDAANKVFLLFGRFGVATAGQAYIRALPIEHYMNDFEFLYSNGKQDYKVYDVASKLKDFIVNTDPDANVYFMVAGYDGNEAFVYELFTGNDAIITRRNVDENGHVISGSIWNGDTEVVDRLFSGGMTPMMFDVMNIQDAIDFSRHMIKTTINQLRFEPRLSTVGGEIDTLIIKHDVGRFIHKKTLTVDL